MNSRFIRTATAREALEVAKNIRDDDRREVEGLGHNFMALPFSVFLSDVAVAFYDDNDTIAGVAGICPTDVPGEGQIWMVCTPVIMTKPHTFVRNARRWLREQEKNYTLLWNVTDKRNSVHHKFLKALGFKSLRTVYPPPFNLPYYEIVKLCA